MNTIMATEKAALFFTDVVRSCEEDQTATISKLAERYIYHCKYVENMSENTLPTKQTHLKQFVEFCRNHGKQYAEDLTLHWIDFYFYEFAKTHAASTTNSAKRILKSFFRYVTDRVGVKSVNPDSIKSRKNTKPRPRYIEHEVILHVIKSTEDPHAKMLIDLMYETGLRIAEACRLTYHDIDDLRVYVLGKGGKERTVYLTPEARSRLDIYTEEWGRHTGTLFRTNPKTARVWLQRAFKRYAGKHMTPHQLRHSYATRLLLNGCDISSIQKLLGHADVSTTMVYLQLKDDAVERQYYRARKNAHAIDI